MITEKKFHLIYNWIFIPVWNKCQNGYFKKSVEINRGRGSKRRSKTQFYGTQNHQKSLEVNKVCTLICCTDCVLILFPVLWQLAKRIEHYINWKMLSRPILIQMILLSPFPRTRPGVEILGQDNFLFSEMWLPIFKKRNWSFFCTEGSCLMLLLGPGKSRISQKLN